MQTATSPQAMSLMRVDREKSGDGAKVCLLLISEADVLCGGKCTDVELALMARMTFGAFSHRSVESLVLAIKDGLARTDNEGRVYDKITWPKLHLWLKAHEDKVLSMAEDQHAQTVVKGDNYGADYLDRQQHKDGAKDRLIDQLRRKLEHKEKPKA